jgi:hypothetical protein
MFGHRLAQANSTSAGTSASGDANDALWPVPFAPMLNCAESTTMAVIAAMLAKEARPSLVLKKLRLYMVWVPLRWARFDVASNNATSVPNLKNARKAWVLHHCAIIASVSIAKHWEISL